MSRTIHLIGLPMDLGQARRGVDKGPSALRFAGLRERLEKLGYTIVDKGDVYVPIRERVEGDGVERFVSPIHDACMAAYETGRIAVQEGAIPLFLGGDHSVAIGTVGGVSHDRPVGVIWVDAHGDFNLPETSPNGNIHGMPVSVLLGFGYPDLVDLGRAGPKLIAENIVMIGIRDLDYDEKSMLRNSGIQIYTMSDVDERGIAAVAREALGKLDHLDHLHVSLDMDALDPAEAPGVGTPARGGLTFREAHLLMEIFATTKRISSADIVEVNPILDNHNQTATLGVDLIASLLGQTII